jgi:hypothetical protein
MRIVAGNQPAPLTEPAGSEGKQAVQGTISHIFYRFRHVCQPFSASSPPARPFPPPRSGRALPKSVAFLSAGSGLFVLNRSPQTPHGGPLAPFSANGAGRPDDRKTRPASRRSSPLSRLAPHHRRSNESLPVRRQAKARPPMIPLPAPLAAETPPLRDLNPCPASPASPPRLRFRRSFAQAPAKPCPFSFNAACRGSPAPKAPPARLIPRR